MNSRAAAWAGILLLCLLASSCTRSTPANTQSSQAQPTAEATPQQSPPAPSAAEEPKTPAPPKAATSKTNLPSKPTDSHLAENAPAPTPPPPVILPAGTVLIVRLNDTVGGQATKVGDKFSGSIAQPVTIQSVAVIPAGSPVSGKVDQLQQGGKIKGSSSLSIRLTSVSVKGVSYPISTGSFLAQGKGKGSRTTKMGAGGAAAGAVVGGLSGGGKGALIGSAVGAGAGVAGSAFTGNKELTIPAESVVQFKLAQPLRLTAEGKSEPANDSQR